MNTKEERKRKMLLFLPLLLLPFLALGFYALGGCKGDGQSQNQWVSKGINLSLPGAKVSNRQPQDKMTLYNKAQRDSASANSSRNNNAFAAMGWDTTGYSKQQKSSVTNSAQANEARISQKLAEINKQISQPTPVTHFPDAYAAANPPSPDMGKLEKLLRQKQQGNTPDPEMQQLSGMLDKIMAIQNPGLAQQKAKQEKPVVKDSAFKAIQAVIEGNQKVAQGGVVRLRLLDTLRWKGLLIPKNQLLFGSCNITNQRLLLDIKNIRLGKDIIPVDLTVFSLDGMAGINAPEAELAGAAGNGTDNALQSMEFLPMDQTLSTEAAGAGIEAAKGLIGKKVKRIKVKLKNGYPVLLRNNQLKAH
ncbi:conjugative transposon protein TraM [Mucilaginibacter sp.]